MKIKQPELAQVNQSKKEAQIEGKKSCLTRFIARAAPEAHLKEILYFNKDFKECEKVLFETIYWRDGSGSPFAKPKAAQNRKKHLKDKDSLFIVHFE